MIKQPALMFLLAINVVSKLTMTEKEGRLFQEMLKAVPAGGRYLEYGTGGSTVLASEAAMRGGLGHVDTVDSSRYFFENLVKSNPVLSVAMRMGKVTFHHGDVGKTQIWGIPSDWRIRNLTTRTTQAKAYVVPKGVRCCYDLVLNDGRFRRAVAMHSLRLLSRKNGRLLLHDAQRYMKFMSAHFLVERRVDRLTVLVRRYNYTKSEPHIPFSLLDDYSR